MIRTLISGAEVVQYAPTSYRDESLAKCSFIRIVEQTLFKDCLGNTMYEDMLDDMIDYSQVGAFRENQPYTVGSNVIVNGIIYICIQATTSQTVANSNYWKVANKFSNPAYETLWVAYLAALLATNVQIYVLPTQAISVSAAGLTRSKSDNYTPATLAEISSLRETLNNLRARTLDLMLGWLDKHIADYPLYADFLNINNKSCATKKSCPTLPNYGFF